MKPSLLDVSSHKVDSMLWHVESTRLPEITRWLAGHFPAIFEKAERVLKDDTRSQIAAADGLVIKRFRARRNGFPCFSVFRGSRSKRAFCLGRELIRCGIPTARPVAWATRRRLGLVLADYLITEEVKNSRPLMEILESGNPGASARTEIPVLWGKLLASFHSSGYSNRDLKDTNILVTRDPAQMRLWVVDMEGVRKRRRVRLSHIRRDCWPIMHSLALYEWNTEEDKRLFLDGYHSEARGTAQLRTVPSAVFPGRRPAPDGWQRTCVITRRSGLHREHIEILTPSDALIFASLGHRYWQGRLRGLSTGISSPATVVMHGSPREGEGAYYFKQFLVRNRLDHVKSFFRRSRAERAFHGGRLAEEKGFRVPKTVCVIEEKRFPRPSRSGLITEAVTDALRLDQLLTAPPDGEGTDVTTWRRRLVRDLGMEVGRWHAANLCHGDMRIGNVLCRTQADGCQFYWLDNERTRCTASLHERARNLVQLNMTSGQMISNTDRMRFWMSYTQTAPGSAAELRRLRDAVVRWSRRRWHKRGWL